MLSGPDLAGFLPAMYGNEPARWSDTLEGPDRWRHVINVLTRIRFVDPRDGRLDFKVKEGLDAAPPGLVRVDADGVQVTEAGWYVVRAVAMVFDGYLGRPRGGDGEHVVRFSKVL